MRLLKIRKEKTQTHGSFNLCVVYVASVADNLGGLEHLGETYVHSYFDHTVLLSMQELSKNGGIGENGRERHMERKKPRKKKRYE